MKMLASKDPLTDPSGADDNQMPAFCVIPALAAADRNEDVILHAAQVISINTDVLAGIQAVCQLLQKLRAGVDIKKALHDVANEREDLIGQRLQQSLALTDYQPVKVGDEFGRACGVLEALPVVWHLLHYAENFESMIRDNIRCGGDSCGRCMVLGSVAGMVFGIPEAMRNRVVQGALPVV